MRPLLPLVLLGLASCTVDTDESIFVEGVLTPKVEEDGCVYQAVLSNPTFSLGGLYDIGGATSGYFAALQVRTNLPSTFNTTDVTQSKTQSPNYPSYGPVDNNVVIFETAKITYELLTDETTGELLEAAAQRLDIKNLACDKGVCEIEEQTVTATGAVFNAQTSLNTASVASTDLVPLSLARNLAAVVDEAGALASPNERMELKATVSIVASTTGSGDIRKVTSFPMTYPIELCVGCIAATDEICERFNAVVAPSPNADKVCDPGQDALFQACVCVERDNAGRPVEPQVITKVVTEADSCDEEAN